jgi:hypothetical protein
LIAKLIGLITVEVSTSLNLPNVLYKETKNSALLASLSPVNVE